MKVVILAGGFGTRISEESQFKPKPMIEIGGMPILWHIMKTYSSQGFNEFIICAGYKQEVIKKWFNDYAIIRNDVTFDYTNNGCIIHKNNTEPWKVTVIDTGLNTQTGGRIKRIKEYIGNDEEFMVTYGDGISDINFDELLAFHHKNNKIGTISVYNFGQTKGVVEIDGDEVKEFREKSDLDGDLINIGFMVFKKDIFDYIDGDETVFEDLPMKRLIDKKELVAYKHYGFWRCMDTLRDKEKLEKIWNSDNPVWKRW